MRERILLVTTVDWPSAARLAGALATLGAHVEALCPPAHVLNVSRYPSRLYRYSPLFPHAALEVALCAAKPDRIIACDDRALALLLNFSAPYKDLLTRSMGPLEHYSLLTARVPSIAAARDLGIAAPLTLAVDCLDALPAALEQVGFPCVVKSDGSWGGDGVIFVQTAAEAEKAFLKLQGPPSRARSLVRSVLRRDAHFLCAALRPQAAKVCVQAAINGAAATTVFAAREGRVLAALHMDMLASQKNGLGPARVMRRLFHPAMDEAAAKLAARFALNGLIGLDFMRDGAGTPHLIEINPRATQICHLPLGQDLPAALLGVPARPAVTEASCIALFPHVLDLPAPQDLGLKGSETLYRDLPCDDPAVLGRYLKDAASGTAKTV